MLIGFDSHRLPIAIKSLEQGFEVHLVTTLTRNSSFTNYSKLGIHVHPVIIDRSFKNPFVILKLFLDLIRIFYRVSPDILHLVTIQPVIIGGIVARLLRIKSVVYAISGLGHNFISNSILTSFRRHLLLFLYSVAFGVPNEDYFQNHRDLLFLVSIATFLLSIHVFSQDLGQPLCSHILHYLRVFQQF